MTSSKETFTKNPDWQKCEFGHRDKKANIMATNADRLQKTHFELLFLRTTYIKVAWSKDEAGNDHLDPSHDAESLGWKVED